MKKFLRILLPLLAAGIVLTVLHWRNAPPIRRAALVMDPTYSRSASNVGVVPPFLQTDGRSLYYISRWNTPHILAVTGKSSRMEILLPAEPAQEARSLDPDLPLFLCDDSFYIGGSTPYLLSRKDETAREMSVRYPFAFVDQTLYYTTSAPTQETGYYPELLCTYHIPTGETREWFIMDDLTAVYSDGFVYESENNFYYLPLPYAGEEPVLLPKLEGDHWLFTLLCTDTRMIQLDTNSIKVCDFADGTTETIFASDGILTMAACANEEEMYVSRRLVDIKFWPVDDPEGINGTYRYTFADGTWEKINNTIYESLVQFDGEYLYGRTYDWRFLRQIRLK